MALTCCTNQSGFLAPENSMQIDFTAAYHLGPGDVVMVKVFEEPELSGEFKITGSDTITLPLAGEVDIGGRTLAEARQRIEDALKEGFLLNPRVSVTVSEYRDYYILGEVRSPEGYPFEEGINVLNAIAVAGGFTYRAETGKVKIVRPGTEEPQLLVTGIHTPIFPGDVIYVEEKIF